jgi:uncharacterized OB-fold protein
MATSELRPSKRVAIREGLFVGPLDDLSKVRLQGSRCKHCGEVTLGESRNCPNCGVGDVEPVALSDRGELWTYTVVRHKPPGDYRGPEPFQPFCVGLVELPDGLRVMSPIEGEVDSMKIGTPLRLHISVHHLRPSGEEVIGFSFAPRR